MTTKSTILCLFFTLNIVATQAQEPLSIPTQNRCTFSGSEWDDDLYRFDANQKVESWVNEITQLGNIEKNFELVPASIENVSAIFDPATQKRYVLYSQNFIEKTTKLGVFASLAHEIGHHANLHQLTEARRNVEELEADEFMGFVLAKLEGVASIEEALNITRILPTSYPQAVPLKSRAEAIKMGWSKGQKALLVNGSKGFDTDEINDFLRAKFPFPPPPCCSPREIPSSVFSNSTQLKDVANILTESLEKQGYVYRNYLSVPDGFALVTLMEQNNADLSCRVDGNRWSGVQMKATFNGYLDYFKRLLMPAKANFRTFVFIVTAKSFNTQGNNVTKKEAAAWYSQGINKLPKLIAEMPYTEGVTVTALVYEFEVPESNRKPVQKCPGVDTQKHLEKSGLWKNLVNSRK